MTDTEREEWRQDKVDLTMAEARNKWERERFLLRSRTVREVMLLVATFAMDLDDPRETVADALDRLVERLTHLAYKVRAQEEADNAPRPVPVRGSRPMFGDENGQQGG